MLSKAFFSCSPSLTRRPASSNRVRVFRRRRRVLLEEKVQLEASPRHHRLEQKDARYGLPYVCSVSPVRGGQDDAWCFLRSGANFRMAFLRVCAPLQKDGPAPVAADASGQEELPQRDGTVATASRTAVLPVTAAGYGPPPARQMMQHTQPAPRGRPPAASSLGPEAYVSNTPNAGQ